MSDIKGSLTRSFGKAKLGVIKHSDTILLVSGIISGGLALATAIKSTLEVEEIIDNHNARVEKVKAIEVGEELENEETGEVIEYTESTKKRVVTLQYGRTAWELFKLYAPTIIFTAASITCILTSHGILKKRNAALAASLGAVRTAFDEYRGRVVRDLGTDMDEHFLYDTVEKVIEHEEVDEESGKTKKIKEKIQVPTKTSVYSRFFDESNPNWEKDGSSNYFFVSGKMKYLQSKLKRDGFLFLNDVYRELGLPITIAGQSAGWIYDFDNKNQTTVFLKGFGGIDFDETRLSGPVRAFMNGYERNCLLEFENIQDNILDDLPRVYTEVEAI